MRKKSQNNSKKCLNEWDEILNDPKLPEYLNQPETRKYLVRKFFFLFWYWYFPHYHKRSIPNYKIDQCSNAREDRLIIVDARDHGKSVLWSCAFPLWVALTNPYDVPVIDLPGGGFRYEHGFEEIICQISCAGDLPKRFIKRHKRELTANKNLIADWGNQSTRHMAEGSWTAEHLLLQNGAEIYSKGSGAQIRGDHPTELVVDDLEDRKASQNPENRKKDRAYFFSDLYGAVEPYTRVKVIGTIVHNESLLKLLLDREIEKPEGIESAGKFLSDWKKFKYQALLPDGSPLAPEIWPLEALLRRKAELQTFESGVWETEYMNNPQSSDNPVFPEPWLLKENSDYDFGGEKFQKILPLCRKFHFNDPAAGEREINDYSAIVSVGCRNLDKIRPEIYVLEAKRYRHSTMQGQLKEVLDSWMQWRGKIGFEAIAYQGVLKPTFDLVCKEAGYRPDTYQTKYHEYHKTEPGVKRQKLDKVSRARLITHFFELGWIFFNHNDPMQQILLDDLKVFPTGEHDDLVDALVGCLWEVDRLIKLIRLTKQNRIDIEYDKDTGRPMFVNDSDSVINNMLDQYFD